LSLPLNRSNVPPRPKDVLWIERLKGTESLRFTCYSKSFWGLWTHWSGSRTVPCFENHDHCIGGHDEATMRWKGYLHGWSQRKNRVCFCEFTPGAARELLEQVPDRQSLRGLHLIVSRTKTSKGRLHCSIDGVPLHASRIPPEADPMASLWHMWELDPMSHLVNRSLVTAPELVPMAS